MDRLDFKKYYQDEKVVRDYKSEDYFDSLVIKLQAEFLNNLILKRNIDLVLDLACGLGKVGQDLFGFKQGIALDSSQEMLRVARQLLGKKWFVVEGDAFELTFEDEFFDLVYCFDFLDRFDPSNRILIYNQVFRILKKKGLFVFDVLDEINIEEEIKSKGFNVVEVKDYVKFNSFKWLFRLLPEEKAIRLAYSLEKFKGLGKPKGRIYLCEKL